MFIGSLLRLAPQLERGHTIDVVQSIDGRQWAGRCDDLAIQAEADGGSHTGLELNCLRIAAIKIPDEPGGSFAIFDDGRQTRIEVRVYQYDIAEAVARCDAHVGELNRPITFYHRAIERIDQSESGFGPNVYAHTQAFLAPEGDALRRLAESYNVKCEGAGRGRVGETRGVMAVAIVIGHLDIVLMRRVFEDDALLAQGESLDADRRHVDLRQLFLSPREFSGGNQVRGQKVVRRLARRGESRHDSSIGDAFTVDSERGRKFDRIARKVVCAVGRQRQLEARLSGHLIVVKFADQEDVATSRLANLDDRRKVRGDNQPPRAVARIGRISRVAQIIVIESIDRISRMVEVSDIGIGLRAG